MEIKTENEVRNQINMRTPIDRIIEIYEEKGFFEVVGKAGGDTLTYRLYKDGSIYER